MNNSKRILFRILLLTSIAILMILLCGCRTRLSNNSDVHSRIEDESGYLSENYEYRRDDLGLSVAEKPLINPDNGEDEEEDYEDYDEDFDYEPAETDMYEEDDTTTEEEETSDKPEDDTSKTTTTKPASGTTRRTSTGIRRPSTTTPTTTVVKVTLNANGGKCTKTSIYVRTGSTYGTLPEAQRDGYKFKGWYTKKKDGSKVTSKTKVTNSNAHTLYAHWKKQVKKTYTVTFDGNGGADEVILDFGSVTVEEGGVYGELPKARRTGYGFDGWWTEPANGAGKKITKSTKFTGKANQTLYAHWNEDHNAWWEGEFKEAANEVTDKTPYFIVRDHPDPDCHVTNKDAESIKNMFDDCKGIKEDAEGDAYYSILLLDPKDNVFEDIAYGAALAYYEQKQAESQEGEAYSGIIIVVSKDALKNNSNENLVARLRLLYELYGMDLDTAKAAEQLGVDKSLIYVFTP